MLSYQHTYHAGCFADVVKHIVLTRLLNYLTQKDKPLFYMETHAGRGMYDLESDHSKKTGERVLGIDLFWQTTKSALCKPYEDIIRQVNPDNICKFYPGSPYFAQQQLRPIDRIVLCERHPQEFTYLQEQFYKDRRITCIEGDGIHQLKALLPPKEKRGLIFIDPAFEVKTEYKDIPEAVKLAYKRFPGTYCLWYPIIDNKLHKQWTTRLASIPAPHLRIEFKHKRQNLPGMNACGVWIIRPPYTLPQELKNLAPLWNDLLLNMDISTWTNDTPM